MKISVVIPTKDDEEVFETVESVLDQSHGNFEAIVVDGSTGEHREKLEEFCDEEGVRYVHESERDHKPGLNGSRNIGAEEASGEVIALLDGDCIATENWLEKLEEKYQEGFDIVESRVEYLSPGKNCPMDRTVQNTGKNYRFLGAALTFRKEVWGELEFDEDLTFHDDTDFGFRAMEKEYRYGFAEEAVVKHNAGRFTALEFLTERRRFEGTPEFVRKHRESDLLEKEVPRAGMIIYPKEIAYLGTISVVLLSSPVTWPYNGVILAGLMALPGLLYLERENAKRDLDFCLLDFLKVLLLSPFALAVKRLSIWKGALKNRVPVI